MKAAVFDTYVTKRDNTIMHFDIVVKEGTVFNEVQKYGRAYLALKGQEGQPLTAEECRFCHIEQASPALEVEINTRGYYIVEMEGCH